MTVNVKFVGSFRGLSGKEKLTLNLESVVQLRTVVNRIVEELPKLKMDLIDSECGEPKTNLLVLVNGREISVLNGFETLINDGDEVVFVPVVHGG